MSPRDLQYPPPAEAAADVRRDRLNAIALMCGAIALFAVLDATGKYVVDTRGLPVTQAVWLRFVGHSLVSAALFWPFMTKRLFETRKLGTQIARSGLMVATTICNFFALRHLQLDQTVTIFFLTPLVVAALGGPLLGEWVGWRRLMAILTGFIGVLLVTRPGFGGIHWAVFFSLGSMLAYALYSISTRYLARFDSSEVTQIWSPLAGVLILAPFGIAAWQPPSPLDWLWLAILGGTGALGHWLLILAHRHAPAPVLSPFVYTGLLWMSALGYVVFGHVPTFWTLSGGAIVIASGLYLLYRERAVR